MKILGRTDLGGDELLSFQGEMSQKAVGENGKKIIQTLYHSIPAKKLKVCQGQKRKI